MIDKYKIEDALIAELQRMTGFIQVDDTDVGLVHFRGLLDVGRLAENLAEYLDKHGYALHPAVDL